MGRAGALSTTGDGLLMTKARPVLRLRALLAFGVVLVALLAGCATVPFDFPKTESRAIPPSETTRLGKAVAERSRNHGNESSFYALSDGLDALGARLRLIEQA